MRYEKLVRSKVLDDLTARNIPYKSHIADPSEYDQKLHSKLLEEASEFIRDRSREELADVLEVVHTLARHHGWSYQEIEDIRLEKRAKKGSFEEPIILEES
jgi:predicted house-cleaning noncanonical NTP pyrophosphatase (MazG superfamily)